MKMIKYKIEAYLSAMVLPVKIKMSLAKCNPFRITAMNLFEDYI